ARTPPGPQVGQPVTMPPKIAAAARPMWPRTGSRSSAVGNGFLPTPDCLLPTAAAWDPPPACAAVDPTYFFWAGALCRTPDTHPASSTAVLPNALSGAATPAGAPPDAAGALAANTLLATMRPLVPSTLAPNSTSDASPAAAATW